MSYLNLAESDGSEAGLSNLMPGWLRTRGRYPQFDWVLSIEVAEHVPAQSTERMIRTWEKLCRLGLIVSWSEDTKGIGHVNPLPFETVTSLIERVVGGHVVGGILVL